MAPKGALSFARRFPTIAQTGHCYCFLTAFRFANSASLRCNRNDSSVLPASLSSWIIFFTCGNRAFLPPPQFALKFGRVYAAPRFGVSIQMSRRSYDGSGVLGRQLQTVYLWVERKDSHLA